MSPQDQQTASTERDVIALFCLGITAVVACVSGLLLIGVGAWLIPKSPITSYICEGGACDETSSNPKGQIAFVSDRDGNPEIYIMNEDGSGATRLTYNPTGDFNPAWSPDGTQIAFHSERDGNGEIYVMNADGSGKARRLTTDTADDFSPSWSADGTQIAFHSHRYLGAARLFVMNTDGSRVTRLTDPQWDDWSPDWSPDGTRIVFNSSRFNNRDIWLMNADGSGMTNLTRNPADDWWPAWSPDGTQIVFHSDRDGGFDIYSMNSDGSEVTRLTDSAALDYDPVWSPNGKFIAFTSDRAGNRDIWVMNADGSGVANLTQFPAHDWAPDWRPDGTTPLAQSTKEAKDIEAREDRQDSEIETAEPGANLAYQKSVMVSRALADNPAKMAVDGRHNNWRGSGAFAPQWIQVDLGSNYVIAEVRLLPSQTPAGRTIHRLLGTGSATDNKYVLLHTFEGSTADSKWLTIKFPEPLRGIRYIRIETTRSPSWISWREIEVIAGE